MTFRYLRMRFTLLLLVMAPFLRAQELSYSPGMTIEKTVSLNYYDTEYIFIDNFSEHPIDLYFELVSANIPEAWSATGCTNMICYIKIPDQGMLGTVGDGSQAYLSINLAANETAGDGEIRYRIYSPQFPGMSDTISFVYHAEESIAAAPQPWARIQVAQQVITVFLENEAVETTLAVFDLNGNRVLHTPLEAITSYSMATLTSGVYIVHVSAENGRELIQKVVHVN